MLPRPPYHYADGSGRLTAAVSDALLRLEVLRPKERTPRILAYFKPVPTNPFQSLLYSRCWDHGIAPVAIPSIQSLDELPELANSADVVLHLHWTAPLTLGAENEEEARGAAAGFIDQVRAHRSRGGRFVWTIHNVMPHECPFPNAELWLRRELVTLADAIHVLSRATAAEVEQAGYPLPRDRVAYIAHPSYVGAYPTLADVQATRAEAGLHPTAPVVGTVGAIRPYKRIPDLLEAFDQLLETDPEPRPQLLVAGGGADRSLRDAIERHPAAIGVLEHVDAQRLASLVRSCDLIALPYVEALNSGAMILALSCERPVVAPRVGGLEELAAAPAATFFHPNQPGSLVQALQEGLATARDPVVKRAARAAVDPLEPDLIAERFAQFVGGLVQTAPSDA